MRRSILTLLLLSAAGCGSIFGPSQTTLHFTGTVTAVATGQPVAGAVVDLGDPLILWGIRASATADALGRYSLTYSIENCIDGDVGITLTASGSGLAHKTVQPACNDSMQQFDFSLAAATTP